MLDPSFFSYVTVMSITPGPNNLLLATSGVNFGLRRTLPMISGILLGCLLQNALAVLAVACWTWYPLRNARWLRTHPQHKPATWATAQGIVTLPLALVMYALVGAQLAWQQPNFALPFGPQPQLFLPLMLMIGLLCSWLGTLCWNAASQRLPTVFMGPLIVFETLSGLLWTFLWRQSWPPRLSINSSGQHLI